MCYNHQEWRLSPKTPTGEEVLRWGTQRSDFLNEGSVENSNVDPVKLHGIKQRSILFIFLIGRYVLAL